MFNDILKNNKAQYIYVVVDIANQTGDIFFRKSMGSQESDMAKKDLKSLKFQLSMAGISMIMENNINLPNAGQSS